MFRYLNRFTLLLPLLCIATDTIASPSVVTSGEHDGFSRIVASVPAGVSWHVGKNGEDVVLQLQGHIDGFKTSEIFKRISKKRVFEFSQTNDGLTLKLACDCDVAAFPSGAQYVVIDVVTKGTAYKNSILIDTRSTQKDAKSIEIVEMADELRNLSKADKESPNGGKSIRKISLHPRTPLSDQEQTIIGDLQNSLARELGSATTRGILDQSAPLLAGNATPTRIDGPRLDQNSPLPLKPRPFESPAGRYRNLKIGNSIAVSDPSTMGQQSLSKVGLVCPKSSELKINNWGGNISFQARVSSLRAALYGEFDHLNRDVALELARTYLFYGFGAEAQQVLTLDAGLMNDERLLVAISNIMERGRSSDSNWINGLMDCHSDVSLWAILAKGEVDKSDHIDAPSALLALNKLPPHLRDFIAPALSQRLRRYGNKAAAATALRSLDRLAQEMPPGGKLARAEISLDLGKNGQGITELIDVVNDNSLHSPEALIALVDANLDAGYPIRKETADLIEAYAKELRGTQLGPELHRSHVMTLVKSGQFYAAFKVAAGLSAAETDIPAADLRLRLIEETTKRADDVTFLDLMFQQNEIDLGNLPSHVQIDVAERYLSLGFGIAAQGVVDMIPDQPVNPRRQKLAAQIALQLRRPALAQAELLGLNDMDANLIRAKAKKMAGAYLEAHEIYRDSSLAEDAETTAWLSEDWEKLLANDASVLGAIAGIASQQFEINKNYDGMLARSADALTESNIARQQLTDFLSSETMRSD